jgi:tetratricopeptide (TPR) repeat protein
MNLYRFNPDEAVFYLSRAKLMHEFDGTDQLQDLEKAMNLAPDDWRVWSNNIAYFADKGNHAREMELAETAYRKWPDNYDLGLSYASSLLSNKEYGECLSLLKKINVLPFEGAGASHTIYERAHLGEAMRLMEKDQYKKAITVLEAAKLWPENLGVGKPYRPDKRQIDYLQGICYRELGQVSNQEVSQKALQDFTVKHFSNGHPANILGLLSLETSGRTRESQDILKELSNSERLSDQWVVAQYNQDEAVIMDLSGKINQADPIGYGLLKQMIQYN